MPLVWFCIAWLLGIVIGDWLRLPIHLSSAAIVSLAAVAGVWWAKQDVRLPLLLAVTFVGGATWFSWFQPETTASSVWAYTGHKVTITGVVTQQPDRREYKQSAVMAAEQLLVGEQLRQVDGQVLLRLPPNPELQYGQRLTVSGRLEQPQRGDDFDYRMYLARHGIYALMSKPKVTLLAAEGGTWWQRSMLRLNDHARRTGVRLISEPHASLLVGILLGVQSTIPDDVLEAFSATGTSHILVISGWNISVIIAGVVGLLQTWNISRKRAAALCLPVIVLYVLFVGATPSVVRAAVMGSLAVVAVLVERETEAWTALLVACVAMTLSDPNVLWDIGFQLSALATAGLFAFARPIEQWLERLGPFRWRGLRWTIEPLTATLAASLLSLPVILYHFGRFSLIAPIANVLMLPVVPYAMLFGSLATVAGMVWLPLGQVVALFAWPFLQWLLVVSRWLSRVPGAYTTLPPFSVWWLWGWYVGMIGLYGWLHKHPHVASDVTPPIHAEPVFH